MLYIIYLCLCVYVYAFACIDHQIHIHVSCVMAPQHIDYISSKLNAIFNIVHKIQNTLSYSVYGSLERVINAQFNRAINTQQIHPLFSLTAIVVFCFCFCLCKFNNAFTADHYCVNHKVCVTASSFQNAEFGYRNNSKIIRYGMN